MVDMTLVLAPGGGVTWVFKIRGCAIQIVKVPPINRDAGPHTRLVPNSNPKFFN